MKLRGEHVEPDVGCLCLVTGVGVRTFAGGREEQGEAEIDFIHICMARII